MGIWKNSITKEKIEEVVNSREKRQVRTMHYFNEAWNLVQQDLGLHIGFALITFVISYFVGFLGSVLYAGWFIAAYMKRKGELIDFSTFFKSFDHIGGLLIQLLIMFGIFFLPIIFMMIFFFIGIEAGGDELAALIMLPFAFIFIILMLVSMMFIFAPLFIVFSDMGAWDSIKSSFKLVKNNLGGFIGFFCMYFVLMILGLMTCGLLLLVITPVLQVAVYFAYEDLFQPNLSDDDDILRHLV